MVGHKLQMLMLQYVLDGLKLIQTERTLLAWGSAWNGIDRENKQY